MSRINRKSYNSTISANDQPGYNKVIVSNITGRGFAHIVTVRATFDEAGTMTEHFCDVLVHPDRAMDLDVQKFDCVTLNGTVERQPQSGVAKPNTRYVFAQGVQAIGKHLVNRIVDEATGETKLEYAGIGVFALATAPEAAN